MASSIIDRVRKLLALAKGNTNAEESAAAAAKAAELIERHRISQAMLEGADGAPVGSQVVWVGRRMPWWQMDLCKRICTHFGAFMLLSRYDGKQILMATGRPEDIEASRVLFAYVQVDLARQYDGWRVPYVLREGADGISTAGRKRRLAIRDGFFLGALQVISHRLAEMRARVRAQATAEHGARGQAALMVIDQRMVESKALADRLYPDRGETGGNVVAVDQNAIAAGAAAARAVDLGGRKLAGARE